MHQTILACLLLAPTPDQPPRTDLYDDPLPAGAVARKGTARLRTVGGTRSLVFSPDGMWLVQWDGSNTLVLFESLSGRIAGRISSDDIQRLSCFAFSPDGKAQAVALLAKRLRPVPADGLAELIADLDAEVFAKCQKATQELRLREFAARDALRKILAGKPTLEQRLRAEKLLRDLEDPVSTPELLRPWRAVMVLEQIGTPEARKVLQSMAQGALQARLTRDARAALDRLPKAQP
jgi:hypothetical protein